VAKASSTRDNERVERAGSESDDEGRVHLGRCGWMSIGGMGGACVVGFSQHGFGRVV
jgi:hypothetical protein